MDLLEVGALCHLGLSRVHPVLTRGQGTHAVHQHCILNAQLQQQLADGDACRTGTVDDHLYLMDVLFYQLQGTEQTCRHHDGGAVLVVVEHRNVQLLFQAAFDLKAARCADVLQVDAAKGESQVLDGLDDLLRVLGVQADGESVDVRKGLE